MVAGYPAPAGPVLERWASTRSAIDLPWNHWSDCRGIGDRIALESVIDLPWNRWSKWRGIRNGRLAASCRRSSD